MLKLITLTLLIFTLGYSFSQVNADSLRQIVLKENLQDSLFTFGKWDKKTGSETHLKYLGIINSSKGNYKIMTSSWIWGHSKRATNRILVFNSKNEYLGNYKLTLKSELPTKIINNQLEFLISKSADGHRKKVSRLAFENGIPKQFFLASKNGSGNFYHYDIK